MKTINPFITRVKSPRVIIFIGSVKKTKIGFIIAFNIPKTRATKTAVIKFVTFTPLIIYGSININREVKSHLRSICIYFIKLLDIYIIASTFVVDKN